MYSGGCGSIMFMPWMRLANKEYEKEAIAPL